MGSASIFENPPHSRPPIPTRTPCARCVPPTAAGGGGRPGTIEAGLGVDLATIGSASVCNFTCCWCGQRPNDLYGFRNNRQVLCVDVTASHTPEESNDWGDGFFLIGAGALAYIIVRGLWRPPGSSTRSDQQSGSSDINSPIGF